MTRQPDVVFIALGPILLLLGVFIAIAMLAVMLWRYNSREPYERAFGVVATVWAVVSGVMLLVVGLNLL